MMYCTHQTFFSLTPGESHELTTRLLIQTLESSEVRHKLVDSNLCKDKGTLKRSYKIILR